MQEKLKSWLRNDQVFYGLLLVLVSLGSFLLGQLSVSPATVKSASGVDFTATVAVPTVDIDKELGVNHLSANTVDSDLSVVASKSGTKYHLPSCPGAKQIKSANLISFSSKEEAERAGYTPAANCPGLQ